MELGREAIVGWVRAPRAWLGSFATVDLLRALPTGVPDWLLAGASVGAALVPGAATPVTLCLFAGGLYTFAPRFYPDRMSLPDEAPGFRLLVTAVALAVALLVVAADGVTDLAWGLGAGGVILSAGICGFLGYLTVFQKWSLLDAEDPPVEPLAGLVREEYTAVEAEIGDDLDRNGFLGALGALFWLLALGLIVAIPAVIAGFVANVLYNAYPLPELLVLAWVAAGTLERRVPSRRPHRDAFDLENRLYGTVKHATRTVKGLFVTLFAICGLFGGAGYVFVGVQLLAGLPLSPGALLAAPVPAVALLAFATGPLVAGTYLIWCWLRQFRRLSPFLDRWVGDDAPGTAPARPLLFTVPPTLLVLLVGTLLGGYSEHPLVGPVAAVVLPAGVVALLSIVRWTRRRPETPLGREALAVTVGLIVQYVGLSLLGNADQLWPALVERRLPPALLDRQLLVLVGLVLAVTVYPELDRFHASADGRWRYLRSAFLCGFGLVFGALSTALSGGLQFALLGIAVIALLGGLALTATTYYDL